MQFIANFIRNPVKVLVGVILVTLFGLIAIGGMPIQLVPEVQIPTLSIETRWIGATPEDIEKEIVQEQEEQLQSVEGITKMSSECSDSSGKITIEFGIGTNLDAAITTVNSRLQQVREYPADADKPVITTSNASDRPIAWFILNQRVASNDEIAGFQQQHPGLSDQLDRVSATKNSGLALLRLKEIAAEHPAAQSLLPPDLDVTTQRRFAEDAIEARFEKVEGVSGANVLGGMEDELQVIVDTQQLAARGLTVASVRNALREQNIDTSGGDMWDGKRRYVVRTLGRFRSVEQVSNAVIARRMGNPIYVRDVAEVKLGFKKPDGMVRRFGASVIAINVLRRTGTNVLEVQDRLNVAVAELNEGILKSKGLQLTQVYDETEYINSSISLVWDNILEGAVLTFIVLLLFLRSLRSSIVVFVSIAVSIVGMFLMMSMMGRTLNVPSLAGIAFAVGMLVDNFIVVLENAHRHRQMGKSAFQASLDGASEVWGAIITSTLANLAVFIPVLFVKDEAGQLFRDIALATASALAMSLFVALIFVPMASARMMSGGKKRESTDDGSIADLDANGQPVRGLQFHVSATRWEQVRGNLRGSLNWLDGIGNAFVNLVGGLNAWLQQRAYRMLATSLVFVVATMGLAWLMMPKIEYLPNGNRNLVIGLMLPPPGYNLNQMRDMGQDLERRLRPFWDSDGTTVTMPWPDPANPGQMKETVLPVIADFFYVARGRQLFMGVRAADPERAGQLVGMLQGVAGDLPGTMVLAFQSSLFEQGLTAGRNIDIEITGPDIKKLVGMGQQVFMKTREILPGTFPIPKPSLDLNSPEMHIVPKIDEAEDQGFRADELGYAVNALVDGAYATDYFHQGDKIDLSIVGAERFANRTEDLLQLDIASPGGGITELGAVATVQYSSGPEQINRREKTRAITISVSPPPDIPLEEAIDRVNNQIIAPMKASGQIGDGLYDVKLSGTADKLRLAWDAMKFNLLLALIITYLVMAALFESWLYPFVIILSVPLGAVGGFLGLQTLNWIGIPQSLDVLTMLGFIILIGTVVNNPILIVEQALNLIDEGLPHRQAVVEAVRQRIRPIFMTTLIGFFGLLPLVISPGAGSELYRGIGSVLLGGLMVSTMFTLFLVPCLFSLALEIKAFMVRQLRYAGPSSTMEVPDDGYPSAASISSEGLSVQRERQTKTTPAASIDTTAVASAAHPGAQQGLGKSTKSSSGSQHPVTVATVAHGPARVDDAGYEHGEHASLAKSNGTRKGSGSVNGNGANGHD